ncbi:MAG TPA: hypothetical protein VN886_01175 [Acidimicrobiales bacterium]|nr:hypothetical protein [Acidimicrobiales bacterium]
MALVEENDPWAFGPDEIGDVQIAAANERFAEKRQQIRVLDRRATDEGKDTIKGLSDLVPLLFAHTTYKSYPEAFTREGRWDRMTKWLGTVCAGDFSDVQLEGIGNADQWVDRMRDAGHMIVTSSGTTGYVSYLHMSPRDLKFKQRNERATLDWVTGSHPADLATFYCSAAKGYTNAVLQAQLANREFARPGSIFHLTSQVISLGELNRQAELRRRVIDGTIDPADLATEASKSTQRQALAAREFEAFVSELIDHRSQPLILCGPYIQVFSVIEAARSRGIKDGDFVDVILRIGGGLKGSKLPADFRDQIATFFGAGPDRWSEGYGMGEILLVCPKCRSGRFHVSPWVIPLVLDKSGERLVERDGRIIEGRAAFFDTASTGRWGGIITGDKVKIDLEPCPCGRPSPSILEVQRYSELEGDDKITCSATFDTYVRGLTSEDGD